MLTDGEGRVLGNYLKGVGVYESEVYKKTLNWGLAYVPTGGVYNRPRILKVRSTASVWFLQK